MPERNGEDKDTHSAWAKGALIPSEDVWGLSAFISVDVPSNSRTTLNIQAARTCVGAAHQHSRPGSHTITATALNIKENLNISANRSRHMLFIYKSQTWARSGRIIWVAEGWCNAFGVFWNMMHRCVRTHKEELWVCRLQLAFPPATTPRNRNQLVSVRISERRKERVGVFSVFCLLLRI